MDWTNTIASGTYTFTPTGTDNIDFDSLTTATTWDFPDPLVEWLPYKWKKYIPTWHLVRSYQ